MLDVHLLKPNPYGIEAICEFLQNNSALMTSPPYRGRGSSVEGGEEALFSDEN
jgi:hypothetical protein